MTQENSQKNWTEDATNSEPDSGQSLGQYLQRERLKKDQSVEEVCAATRIPPETLLALEAGNRGQLPVAVFTKGFVKIYAAHLGLNQADVLERFSKEWGNVRNTTPEILSGESMAETSPFFLSMRFFLLLVLIALVISLAYFFFQADDTPPPTSLTTIPIPQEQTTPQVIVKKKETKQLKLNPVAPPQETLLVSPKSAGKIPLENDDEPEQASVTEPVAKPQVTVQETLSEQTPPQRNSRSANVTNPAASSIDTPAQKTSEPAISIVQQTQRRPSSHFQSLNLHIRFIKKTRIAISQDDDHPEKYIFNPGEESTWIAASQITLEVDKADAVELTLNGSPVSIDSSSNGPLAITLPSDISP